MTTQILLADDDPALSRILSDALTEEGYSVTCAADGRQALQLWSQGHFEVLLLDVLMPELDGLEVCRRIRQSSNIPIVFLTSRSDEVDRINGLDIGADDYVTKPFSTRELVARIRALVRRAGLAAETSPRGEILQCGHLKLDVGRFEVSWRDKRASFTRSEFQVLAALARNVGFVLSRDKLIDLACGNDVVITERTIDTFIKRIRQKLKDIDSTFDAIETVIGVGYRLRQNAK